MDDPRGTFFGCTNSGVSNFSLKDFILVEESTESSSPMEDSIFEFKSNVETESSRDFMKG